jgi:hypothetical protein
MTSAPTTTPLGAVARGIAAGLVGTAAMTAWQEISARLMRSEGSESRSSQPPEDPWEQASAPAQVGRRILEGVFEKPVPAERIPLLTNVMHWVYGSGWGAVYGLIAGSVDRVPALRSGLLFGTGVWAMSYVQLVPMGIYEPPWSYSPSQLALDLSYHLAYGTGVGVGYSAVSRL